MHRRHFLRLALAPLAAAAIPAAAAAPDQAVVLMRVTGGCDVTKAGARESVTLWWSNGWQTLVRCDRPLRFGDVGRLTKAIRTPRDLLDLHAALPGARRIDIVPAGWTAHALPS